MDRLAASEEIPARTAVVRGVMKRFLQSRSIHTNISETLPVLPGESDLVLQHLGDTLASIFDP